MFYASKVEPTAGEKSGSSLSTGEMNAMQSVMNEIKTKYRYANSSPSPSSFDISPASENLSSDVKKLTCETFCYDIHSNSLNKNYYASLRVDSTSQSEETDDFCSVAALKASSGEMADKGSRAIHNFQSDDDHSTLSDSNTGSPFNILSNSHRVLHMKNSKHVFNNLVNSEKITESLDSPNNYESKFVESNNLGYSEDGNADFFSMKASSEYFDSIKHNLNKLLEPLSETEIKIISATISDVDDTEKIGDSNKSDLWDLSVPKAARSSGLPREERHTFEKTRRILTDTSVNINYVPKQGDIKDFFRDKSNTNKTFEDQFLEGLNIEPAGCASLLNSIKAAATMVSETGTCKSMKSLQISNESDIIKNFEPPVVAVNTAFIKYRQELGNVQKSKKTRKVSENFDIREFVRKDSTEEENIAARYMYYNEVSDESDEDIITTPPVTDYPCTDIKEQVHSTETPPTSGSISGEMQHNNIGVFSQTPGTSDNSSSDVGTESEKLSTEDDFEHIVYQGYANSMKVKRLPTLDFDETTQDSAGYEYEYKIPEDDVSSIKIVNHDTIEAISCADDDMSEESNSTFDGNNNENYSGSALIGTEVSANTSSEKSLFSESGFDHIYLYDCDDSEGNAEVSEPVDDTDGNSKKTSKPRAREATVRFSDGVEMFSDKISKSSDIAPALHKKPFSSKMFKMSLREKPYSPPKPSWYIASYGHTNTPSPTPSEEVAMRPSTAITTARHTATTAGGLPVSSIYLCSANNSARRSRPATAGAALSRPENMEDVERLLNEDTIGANKENGVDIIEDASGQNIEEEEEVDSTDSEPLSWKDKYAVKVERNFDGCFDDVDDFVQEFNAKTVSIVETAVAAVAAMSSPSSIESDGKKSLASSFWSQPSTGRKSRQSARSNNSKHSRTKPNNRVATAPSAPVREKSSQIDDSTESSIFKKGSQVMDSAALNRRLSLSVRPATARSVSKPSKAVTPYEEAIEELLHDIGTLKSIKSQKSLGIDDMGSDYENHDPTGKGGKKFKNMFHAVKSRMKKKFAYGDHK